MAERETIVPAQKITYEGLFGISEVYKHVQDWAKDKGYVFVEKKIMESVSKKGKNVEAELVPFKSITDYAKSIVTIKIAAHDCTDVEVKKDKTRKKLQKGTLNISTDAILETDYEARWEAKPVMYVIRTLFEKYVYVPFLSRAKNIIKEDVEMLRENLKAFLNLYRY